MSFYRSDKSLYMFKMCLFILNLDFFIGCKSYETWPMGLFQVWLHRLICIIVSLSKHACKEVCDVKPGIDPYPLLAWSCNRWWPDFVIFTACKKSRFGLKRGKKAQCVSNRCKDLFERKKYFGVRCTLKTCWTGIVLGWTTWWVKWSYYFLVQN